MSAVALGRDLGIEAAADLKQQLAPYLGQRCGFGTAFLDSSDSFRDAVRLLGLTAQLGLSAATDQHEQTVENPA